MHSQDRKVQKLTKERLDEIRNSLIGAGQSETVAALSGHIAALEEELKQAKEVAYKAQKAGRTAIAE